MNLRHLKVQRLLFGGLLLVIGLAIVRFMAIRGILLPIRVTSGSMAPWLRGERFQVTCRDCGFVFDVGVESQPRDGNAVCPNCGDDQNPLEVAKRLRGQRVLIDHGSYSFDMPKRFDAIAFDDIKNQRLVVKRALALAGETVEIRGGEIFVDGQMVRKSLDQFRVLATIVHDNRFLPAKSTGIPLRWRADANETGWQSDSAGIRFVPKATGTEEQGRETESQEIDWLTYHHWRCYASNYLRTSEAPISDNHGYNQGESRALAEVTDIVVRLRVQMNLEGWFAVRIHDGVDWIRAEFDANAGEVVVLRNEDQRAAASLPTDIDLSSMDVEFGLLDGQIVVAFNGQQAIRQVYVASEGIRKPISHPIAIGCHSKPVVIDQVVIRRDVFYLGPGNRTDPWQVGEKLGPNRVLFLGDNPSLSEDSRTWGSAGMDVNALRGKVLPLPW